MNVDLAEMALERGRQRFEKAPGEVLVLRDRDLPDYFMHRVFGGLDSQGVRKDVPVEAGLYVADLLLKEVRTESASTMRRRLPYQGDLERARSTNEIISIGDFSLLMVGFFPEALDTPRRPGSDYYFKLGVSAYTSASVRTDREHLSHVAMHMGPFTSVLKAIRDEGALTAKQLERLVGEIEAGLGERIGRRDQEVAFEDLFAQWGMGVPYKRATPTDERLAQRTKEERARYAVARATEGTPDEMAEAQERLTEILPQDQKVEIN